MPPTPLAPPTARAGVGLKPAHYRTILECLPDVGFFEIHAENYMGAGGPPHRYLTHIRDHYPLSVHGVGLSLGSGRPLDRQHLQRLKALVDRYRPALVSEHLAWSTHDHGFFNDLLPLPYTDETLARVAEHIDDVQNVLRRRILLENPSTYVAFAESTHSEPGFLAELVRRTGCGLLLDVNNVYVASTNQGWDPYAYLSGYPLGHVEEIHLAGLTRDTDDQGRDLLIDTHDKAVAAPVWDLFAAVLERTGPLPTLIEWDADIPPWPVLQAEAARAETFLAAAAGKRARSAPAADPGARSLETPAGRGSEEWQRNFAQALRNPRLPVPAGVIGPGASGCARRFDVYRNNVFAGLIGALEDAYPAARRIVGQEFFVAMARSFVADSLPPTPVMLDYGDGFATFIESFEPAAGVPYLADVARIERAWLEAHHAAEAPALAPGAFSDLTPATLPHLRLALHPSARILVSRFPAVTIWEMNTGDGRPAPVDLEAGGEDALVLRPSTGVEVRRLPPGGAAFLIALAEGDAVIDALRQAIAVAPEFPLPAVLAELIGGGAFMSCAFAAATMETTC